MVQNGVSPSRCLLLAGGLPSATCLAARRPRLWLISLLLSEQNAHPCAAREISRSQDTADRV